MGYLVRQQAQTNRIARADLQRGIFYRAALNHDVALSNNDATDFLVTLRNKPYEALKEQEIVKLEAYVFRHMNLYGSVQTSFDQGLLPREMLEIYKNIQAELDRYPALSTKFVEIYCGYDEIRAWEIFEPVRAKIETT
ncbi:MAG: hypothetical protein AAGE01_11650 [Pseudomonadota bacterium]